MLLYQAATAGHNFFFFGAVGEGNIEVEMLEAGTVLLTLGATTPTGANPSGPDITVCSIFSRL